MLATVYEAPSAAVNARLSIGFERQSRPRPAALGDGEMSAADDEATTRQPRSFLLGFDL